MFSANGWVKFHRKIEEWEWYTDVNTFKLFFHLILKANHKDKTWKGVEIKRGQLLTGRKQLAKETGLSEQNIKTSIKHLKMTNEVTSKVTNKYSIITITNYDSYQDEKDEASQQTDPQLTSNQPATNQQLTTTKNVKNGKNEKNNYKEVYDYYISMPNLIKHKKYTKARAEAIKKAMDSLSLSIDECKELVKKHSEMVKFNNESEYDIYVRPIEVFFGQKLKNGIGLICSEYLEGGTKSNRLAMFSETDSNEIEVVSYEERLKRRKEGASNAKLS